MSQNPFKNALVAAGYISILVTLIFNSPHFISDNELGMMLPVIILSVFVISAALMGYVFLYTPGRLFMEGKHKDASKLFFSTLVAFALIIALIVLLWLVLSSVL